MCSGSHSRSPADYQKDYRMFEWFLDSLLHLLEVEEFSIIFMIFLNSPVFFFRNEKVKHEEELTGLLCWCLFFFFSNDDRFAGVLLEESRSED